MKIVLVRDGDILKPETGKLPNGMPKRITIEVSGSEKSEVRKGSKKSVRRKTKHGRIIQEIEDIAKRECPYPYEPDL